MFQHEFIYESKHQGLEVEQKDHGMTVAYLSKDYVVTHYAEKKDLMILSFRDQTFAVLNKFAYIDLILQFQNLKTTELFEQYCKNNLPVW